MNDETCLWLGLSHLFRVVQAIWKDCRHSVWLIRLSEWLLFNTNSAISQLYHGENKLIFNKMMIRSTLYQTNTLSWILIVLVHWNNNRRIDISPHSDTLSWFWVNLSLTQSGEHANHYTTNADIDFFKIKCLLYLFFFFMSIHWHLTLPVCISVKDS